MGKLLRAEPEGSKFLEAYPQVEEALQKANWLQCIKKFKGYHKEVTKAFARSFRDKDSQVEVEVIKPRSSVSNSTVPFFSRSLRWRNCLVCSHTATPFHSIFFTLCNPAAI